MQDLIDKILKIELDWFLSVKTRYPSRCQEHPSAFKLVRRSNYELWSEETLKAYLDHILKANFERRNLMTEKYAKMNNIVPILSSNPLVNRIVEIEGEWAKKTFERYPHAFVVRSVQGFITYLRCELETYSDRTLELYYDNLERARKEGRNLVEEKYLNLFKKLGYESLDEVEESARTKSGSLTD
nr:DUF4125 family protein [Candidatus Njordarchaeota archaeon]